MSTGLLDTSVVIDWDDREVSAALPDEAAISEITLAELTTGPYLASTSAEAARRQARLSSSKQPSNRFPSMSSLRSAMARSSRRSSRLVARTDDGSLTC
jgi:predicted nucleic acid-binding protein